MINIRDSIYNAGNDYPQWTILNKEYSVPPGPTPPTPPGPGPEPFDSRIVDKNGRVYTTVTAGNKIFTVENFKYVPNGVTWVVDGTRSKLERALLNGKDTGISRNTEKEGAFWYTADRVKDYIPDGCRLPTYDDIVDLIDTLKTSSELKISRFELYNPVIEYTNETPYQTAYEAALERANSWNDRNKLGFDENYFDTTKFETNGFYYQTYLLNGSQYVIDPSGTLPVITFRVNWPDGGHDAFFMNDDVTKGDITEFSVLLVKDIPETE
jgi:hypothetical protein